MKVRAHKVTAKDLEPGDLFSAADQFYWDHFDPATIGQMVYIRTDAPCPADQVDDSIHRIQVVR